MKRCAKNGTECFQRDTVRPPAFNFHGSGKLGPMLRRLVTAGKQCLGAPHDDGGRRAEIRPPLPSITNPGVAVAQNDSSSFHHAGFGSYPADPQPVPTHGEWAEVTAVVRRLVRPRSSVEAGGCPLILQAHRISVLVGRAGRIRVRGRTRGGVADRF